MKWLSSVLFLCFVLLISMTEEPKVITNRVVDLDSPDDNPTGIAAVKIKVLDRKKNRIEEAQTNTDGYYTLRKVKIGDDVTIEHYKEHYLNVPEKIEGVIHDYATTVAMLKDNAGEAYYKRTGQKIYERVSRLVALEPALTQTWSDFRHFNLPPRERGIVKQQIGEKVGQSTIDTVDAKYTGFKLRNTAPELAIRVAKQEGFIRDIYFVPGDETLSFESMEALKISASFFKSAPNIDLALLGGGGLDDADITDKRAYAVRNFLVGEGVNPSRLRVISVRDLCQKSDPLQPDLCQKSEGKGKIVLDLDYGLLANNGKKTKGNDSK